VNESIFTSLVIIIVDLLNIVKSRKLPASRPLPSPNVLFSFALLRRDSS